jgi:hypothetical protein
MYASWTQRCERRGHASAGRAQHDGVGVEQDRRAPAWSKAAAWAWSGSTAAQGVERGWQDHGKRGRREVDERKNKVRSILVHKF